MKRVTGITCLLLITLLTACGTQEPPTPAPANNTATTAPAPQPQVSPADKLKQEISEYESETTFMVQGVLNASNQWNDIRNQATAGSMSREEVVAGMNQITNNLNQIYTQMQSLLYPPDLENLQLLGESMVADFQGALLDDMQALLTGDSSKSADGNQLMDKANKEMSKFTKWLQDGSQGINDFAGGNN